MRNFFLISVIFSIFLSSCSKEQEDATPTKFIVGTSADNPPYEFIKEGKIVGFDIDLAKEIARELDQELIIKNIDFPGLLPALLSNNVDVVMAALTVTPERLNNVDFSNSYLSSEMAIIFRDDSEITDKTDLSKLIIGVQFGTTWEEFAKKLVGDSEEGRVKSLANNLTLVQELLNKNIDIVILEAMQVEKFKNKYPNLKSIAIPSSKSEFAIALPKDSELTPKINEAIEKLKADGVFDSLKNKWFNQ